MAVAIVYPVPNRMPIVTGSLPGAIEMMRAVSLLAFISVSPAALLYAAPVAKGPVGDPAAGQSKSAVCATCHGRTGNSLASEWPKLAGQHAAYLVKQLLDLKSGARKSPVMGPMAEPLDEADIADLAAYYAGQSREFGAADADLVKTGERLYRAGNRDRGLPACMACHGPAGTGNPAAGFPSLAGQHAAYTAIQMRAYRSGERNNDRAAMMRQISSRITDAEIEAVSSYIQGLYR